MSPVSYPEDGNIICLEIEDSSFWFKHRNNCILEAISRFPPAGPVFDVGGGNGYVAAAMRKAGIDVVLVEPGIHGSKAAKNVRLLPQVICAAIESARFVPGSLPAVGIFDVLEHVENDGQFLQELHRLLTPSGKLYITVPAGRLLWSNDDVNAGHHRRYSLRTLTSRLSAQGFVIDYTTYFFTLLPLPILIFRALPTLLGMRRRRNLKRIKKEHLGGKSPFAQFAAVLLDWEARRIRHGKAMNFGASCLAVASRDKNSTS